MEPVAPFWFKQRQCKAEMQDGLLKATGPNLGEAYLYVNQGENQLWAAGLRLTPDGPDLATTEPEHPSSDVAWAAAFELYRHHVIT